MEANENMNIGSTDAFWYRDVPLFLLAATAWLWLVQAEETAKLGLSYSERLAVWGDVGIGTIIVMAVIMAVSGYLGYKGGMKICK